MRETLAASALAAALLCSSTAAQSRVTDFSGRWVITDARPEPDEADTLHILPADELLIRQTSQALTIEHPSKKGTHPEARTFEFGSGGIAYGADRSGGSILQGSWGVTFFGTQLMISESRIGPPDATGAQITTGRGSIWLLDSRGRLVIEFREERSRERPKTATRVYVRKR